MTVPQPDDECPPEELSLAASKQSALEAKTLRKEALQKMFQRDKEGRKRRDSRLKAQARMRRSTKPGFIDSDAGGGGSGGGGEVTVAKVVCSGTKCAVKDAATDKERELRKRGFVKLRRHALGPAEKESIAKLQAEKQARLGAQVSRVPVSLSFKMHLVQKALKRK